MTGLHLAATVTTHWGSEGTAGADKVRAYVAGAVTETVIGQ